MSEVRLALVVDDQHTNRLLASTLLKRQGWTVEEADNGALALALAARIIAYTAHAFPEDRKRLLSGGFDDILVKPINRQAFDALIAGL